MMLRSLQPPVTTQGSQALWVLIACACGGDDHNTYSSAVHDSAGIVIVENVLPPTEFRPTWRLSEQPTLQLGVVEGNPALEFRIVRNAVRLADNTIVVANTGSSELRAFDESGAPLWSTGRDGEGPGEFRNIGWLALVEPDTLIVYDRSLRRVSFFDLKGEFVHMIRLLSPGGALRPQAVGVLAGGHILVHSVMLATPQLEPGVHRMPGKALRFAPDGTLTDTLQDLAATQWVVTGTPPQTLLASLPFGRSSSLAVFRQHAYLADNARYEIVRYGPDGAVDGYVRVAGPLRDVGAEHIEHYREQELRRRTDANAHRRLAEHYDEVPWPSTFPAFRDIRVDRIGNLWVRTYAPPQDSTTTFHVFGADGLFSATVMLPPRVDLLEAGDDYVLARWRDDLDVEYVRLYRLTK